MINVILCGGNGTRLWPLSRTLHPKQFSKLIYQQSLFQKTADRNRSLCDSIIVVSNKEHYIHAKDQLEEIDIVDCEYLLEPVGRSTAPAITLACLSLDENDLVFITPSDQVMIGEEQYSEAIEKAKIIAEEGYLVTFGVKPSTPETGYGYIEAEGNTVLSFTEKPDVIKATEFLSNGNYLWNSGMFLFKSGVYLKELKKHSPEIYEASLIAFNNAKQHPRRISLEDMLAIPVDSIDYAVMEKSQYIKVVKLEVEWSDHGSFDSLDDVIPKNAEGNTIDDKHIYLNSYNNLVLSNNRIIATIDVDDLIIIDTIDALLISKRGSSQKVKDIVAKINLKFPEVILDHLKTKPKEDRRD